MSEQHRLEQRKVRFDFANTPLHWVPNEPEASHIMNSLHLILPAGEFWFCRVYNKALPLVTDPQLREDVPPIALLVFSGLWFEIFRRATDSSAVILALVAIVLLANAIWFARRISYCTLCGRTVQDHSGGHPLKCAQCSKDV